MTITLQALSLVEKAELVQFAPHYAWGTNGVCIWMHDGCEVYMDSYMASNGSCVMVTWTISRKPPLGGRPSTKPGDHDTLNTHHRWFILFYHGWEPAWIKTHWNSIWLRARSHMTSHLHMRIRDHTTWFWRSHKFMVAALGLCVKWPLGHVRQPTFRSLSHF